jgi:hypothetical protein
VEAKISYAAGLFDGEGTVTLSRLHADDVFRAPMVSLSSTSFELVQFMKDNFGGAIISHKTYQPHHRKQWSWRLVRRSALAFLEKITPYIVEEEKKRRVHLILDEYLSVTPRNGKYSPVLFQRKSDFEKRFFHPSDP